MEALVILFLLATVLTQVCLLPVSAELVKTQAERLFVSDVIYRSLPTVINKGWDTIKKAEQDGAVSTDTFRMKVFWNDLILTKMKSFHDKLRAIDKVVEEHQPAKYLNKIINITDMVKLEEASNQVRGGKVTQMDFWKESWVKLSSLLIQLHYKYDWIFDHLYKEGYPENLDHELLDDIITLTNRKDKHSGLPYKNRYHYTWYRVDAKDRGVDWEKYAATLDEVAGFTNRTVVGKKLEANLFVGLRMMLGKSEELLGPYRGLKDYSEKSQCLGKEAYAGIMGLDYQIPVYVLLYILNAEMKYYLLRNFAEMYLCVYEKQCDWKLVKLLEKHLRTYYTFYYTEMINAFKVKGDPIENAPPAAWRWGCDPPPRSSKIRDFMEGVSYARFYDFDTTFLAEERDLSLTQTCRDSCDMFDGAFSTIPCEQDEWSCLETDDDFDCWERTQTEKKCPAPARKICPNSGLVCQTTKVLNAEVCPGQSNERYIEWVQSDGKAFRDLGNKTKCPTLTQQLRAEQIHERSGITKFEPQQCEVCLCRCYEPLGNKTHRYISIVPQMSSVGRNRVVSGVQFLKIGNQIHISVAESPLTENGVADIGTMEWITPEEVDNNNSSQVFRLDRESRSIYLDNLISPQGYAITGVRFKPGTIPVDRYQERELGLQIHVTRLRADGTLDPEDAGWVNNYNDTRLRQEINTENLDTPTKAEGPSYPVSGSNQFLRVRGSSVTKDVGQTPVPFFDTQPVSFQGIWTLLRGIGLYYKSTPGYGGFLAFRLMGDVIKDLPPDPSYDLWHHVLQSEEILL